MSAGTPPLPPSETLRLCAVLSAGSDPVGDGAACAMFARIRARLPQLCPLVDGPGLRLAVAEGDGIRRIYGSRDGTIAVIGTLFPTGDETNPEDLVAALSGSDPVQAMQRLSRSCWGRYVCVGVDPRTGLSFCYRDPTGAARLYAWRIDATLVVADDLPLALIDAIGTAPGVDWGAVARLMVRPEMAASRSALRNVTIPVPGAIMRWTGRNSVCEIVWNPVAIAGDRTIADAAALPGTLGRCVTAWTRGESRVSVELSGGLDSSIIAGCLASQAFRPAIGAITLVPHSPGGDESLYARAVAEQWGISLVEVAVRPGELDYGLLEQRPRAPQPAVYGMDVLADRLSSEVAATFGAGLILSGQGGDAVLFQPRSPAIAADYYRLYGIDRRFLALVRDCAIGTNRSVWSVLREALLPRREQERRPLPPGLAGPAALAAWEEGHLVHPWLEAARGLPPGKRQQIAMLANCQLFHGPTLTSVAGRLVHPMLSQPMVELCLRLPVWELVPDIRDRGLARDLFAPLLPDLVRLRRGKGEASGFYNRAIVEHLATLRPLLLDGLLVANGLLDRGALDDLLQPEHLLWRDDHPLIGALVALEIWTRLWS